MSGDARFVSLSAAAATLSELEGRPINRSSVSRYVSQWASALSPRREGRETLVDIDLLARHRRENIRIDRADAAPYRAATETSGHKDRKLAAEASLSEITLRREQNALALEHRTLTHTDQVTAAAAEAIGAMTAALDAAESASADAIARVTRSEARLIRPLLRKLKSQALTAFRDTLIQALPSPEVDAAP